jgi:hypothetical protein
VTPAVRAQLATIADQLGAPIDRVHEEWAERAAIREYLGGMSRAQAEREAVGDAREILGLPREDA